MTDRRHPALNQVAERAAEKREHLLSGVFGDRKDSRFEDLRVLESKLDKSFRSCSYFRVTAATREAWEASLTGMSPEQKAPWGACLLSHLIAQVLERLPHFPTPDSILPHTAYQFSRILNDLEKQPAAPRNLDNDFFLKDLAICRLDSFPCVAQIVDKNSGISSRRVVAENLFREPAALLSMGLRSGFRYAPMFEPHVHTPMMRGFTPSGWDQCFLLVADLLELYPQHLGFTSTAWFWDPELDRVSPGLSFLHKRPLSGGAFLLPAGQKPADISNATYNSEVRRKLYEAGKYCPTGWMMIWPRQALMEWARANRHHIPKGK